MFFLASSARMAARNGWLLGDVQVGIEPAGIDRRHHREKSGTGVELAECRLLGASHEGHRQDGWKD